MMQFAGKYGGRNYNYTNITATKSKYGGRWKEGGGYTDPAATWVPKFMCLSKSMTVSTANTRTQQPGL